MTRRFGRHRHHRRGRRFFGSGGHLAPGDPNSNSGVGVLTVNNNFTAASGGIFDFEIGGTSSYDQLKITGTGSTFTVNGNGFNLYARGRRNTVALLGTFPLIQYPGTMSGSAAAFRF